MSVRDSTRPLANFTYLEIMISARASGRGARRGATARRSRARRRAARPTPDVADYVRPRQDLSGHGWTAEVTSAAAGDCPYVDGEAGACVATAVDACA